VLRRPWGEKEKMREKSGERWRANWLPSSGTDATLSGVAPLWLI
jgi:hypothetical protein